LILPELIARVDGSAPDRLTLAFPPSFSAEIDPPAAPPPATEGEGTGEDAGGEAAEAEPPASRGPVTVEFEADGLEIVHTLLEGGGEDVTVGARTLLAVAAEAGRSDNAAVDLAGLDMRIRLARAPGGPETTVAVALDAVDYLATGATEEGSATRLEGSLAALSLTASSDQRSVPAIAALLAGAPGGGRLTLTLQAGTTEVAGRVEAAETGGGTIVMASGASGGVLKIDGGQLDLSLSAENNRLSVTPDDEAVPVRGGLVIDRIETLYRSPLAAQDEMDPLALRVALGQIHPDEAFWTALDPDGALQREPGEIILDLLGTARMLPADGLPGSTMQAEIGNLTVRHADVALFGATAQTRGDIEFVQPANLPQGTLTIELTRAMELVGDLVRAGLIGIGAAQVVTEMAANLARPGETPDTLIVEATFEGQSILVNGVPLLEMAR
jgi:hypothetical protein